MARVEGDMELLREIVGLFLEETPLLLVQYHGVYHAAAIRVALERAAHALKGSVGNFGTRTAYEPALQLEMMGRGRELAAAHEVYLTLEKEVAFLRDALVELTNADALQTSNHPRPPPGFANQVNAGGDFDRYLLSVAWRASGETNRYPRIFIAQLHR